MGFNVELFYNGPIHYDWEKRAQSVISLNALPFGLAASVRGFQSVSKLIRRLEAFDVVLIDHHIDPFLAYYLTVFLRSKLVWYCGEPLRALWEDRLSGLDYRKLSATVKSTSIKSYGKTLTVFFLSTLLYDTSVSFLRAIDKSTVQRYPMIITNSNYTKQAVERIYDLEKPMPVVYPGVEAQQNNGNHANKELEDYVLTVGAMIPMKNHVALLKAFRHLPLRHRSKVKLVIIGGGPLESETRLLARKLDLENVVFHSEVSEEKLEEYYANCLFVVHLALHEPFGLVPVEAALHGKPSIVSNNGGTSEFIVHGENGFVVDPRNPKDVAGSIEHLIEDRRLASEMGLMARERALKGFTIERSAENLVRTLES
jgi:glycosyltransferase involved in cell wall biosynthesis